MFWCSSGFMSLTSSSNLFMTASLLVSTCASISLIFFCVSSCINWAKSSLEPAYFCCLSWNRVSLCLRYSSISFAASSFASLSLWAFSVCKRNYTGIITRGNHRVSCDSLHQYTMIIAGTTVNNVKLILTTHN